MALQLKLNKVSLSSDGTTLIVQDVTGNYNVSTNPGGYGTPNPDIPNLVLLRWKMYLDTVWKYVTGSYTQSDLAAGFALTTINILLTSILNLLPDGVEQVEYLAGYPVDGDIVTIPGGATVDITGLDTSLFPIGTLISFTYAPNKIYTVIGITGNIITLDTPYGGTEVLDNITIWVVSNTLNVLVQTFAKNNIANELCKYDANDITDYKLTELTKATMDNLAAGAKFDAGDIAGANAIALCAQSKYFNKPGRW